MSNNGFVRIDIPPDLKTEFRNSSFRNGEDMTAVLRQEILAYLDRVNWSELIQSRLENDKSNLAEQKIPSDSVYSNEEARVNEAKAKGSSSDHIRFGLGKDEKSKLIKVCNLRGVVMSALIRLMITRYIAEGSPSAQPKIDFTDGRKKDFFGFNLPIEIDRDFKKACDKHGVSKSRVVRFLLGKYLERVQWSEELRPLNDDSEFPAEQIREEELVGEFKFTHIVLDKASKNKFELACRGRGVRPSSLFRLMIARFIQDPSAFKELESESNAGRTPLEFSCPADLYDLFSEHCAQQMIFPEGLIRQMLLDYLGRVDMEEIRRNRKKGGGSISSDPEFSNEEVSQEDSDTKGKTFSVFLTKAQKDQLKAVCKARQITPSALIRVMMGRYAMTATLLKAE